MSVILDDRVGDIKRKDTIIVECPDYRPPTGKCKRTGDVIEADKCKEYGILGCYVEYQFRGELN